ncbi:MAG TPA: M6 family metalloprotease domain-containing protein [Methylomirabilota bacterium]|nr:M6 family metalloprotease domain-containing protein [Methylomirabilota bacterium]
MRLCRCIVGAWLLCCLAPEARAVAPIFTESPQLRGTHKAAAALERLAHKPPGVDLAVRAQHNPIGHYRALVILLQFPPDPAIPGDPGVLADTLAHPPSAYDSLFFSIGSWLPGGSIRDYYREVSRGQFDIDGVVTRWYTAPHPYSYYTDAQSGFGDPPHNAQQMAHDAVVLADPDYDFRLFDSDGPDGIPDSGDDDGFVDGVFVVHAGPGGEETASENDIHSHKWTLDTVYSSGDIGANGAIKVSVYTTEPEKWVGLAPHTSPNLIMSIGTFCHEFGHVLGLPDLYDTSASPNANEGVGEWDLMGSGNFNHAPGETLGTSPSHFSAWSKQTLGWVTPTTVSVDQLGVTIQPVESGGSTYRLWTNGDNAGEYFLIENRQPIGSDRGLVRRSVEVDGVQAHGLMIYHVDESVVGDSQVARKEVDVIEAGGAESVSGSAGVQNLDFARNSTAVRQACGVSTSITGNRGDRYDPWPGALGVHDFSSASCPTSFSNCGDPTQVGVFHIAENAGVITADLRVRAAVVQHLAIQVDDSPRTGTTNDGDGRAEPGESVRLGIPLLNVNGSTSPALYAKLTALDAYTTISAGDSIDYGTIAPAQTDSGSVVDLSINLSPDPIGASFRYDLYSTSGLAMSDTVQVLLGIKTGICDDFETTTQPWQPMAVAAACVNLDEWHRESGQNHTPGGAWAWKLGPVGNLGSYASDQDARLVSQPIRLTGGADTLTFWQRYASAAGSDGLSVEISTDTGATWTLLHPVPDYPFTDRWGGVQSTFAQAKVPLAGYSGVVQIAFRFRSLPVGGGSGWWIDDVAVSGDATCATTGAEFIPLEARYDAARSRVVVSWDLGSAGVPTVGIDRAVGGGQRVRVANPAGYYGPGSWEDLDLTPGRTQDYWVLVSREGGAQVEYGPVEVSIPSGSQAPRALALGPARPNPFNPEASFPVALDRDGAFALRVYRVDGVLVRTLHDGPATAGVYAFRWDGRDAAGKPLPGGVYLIELKSGTRTRVEKATLLR